MRIYHKDTEGESWTGEAIWAPVISNEKIFFEKFKIIPRDKNGGAL